MIFVRLLLSMSRKFSTLVNLELCLLCYNCLSLDLNESFKKKKRVSVSNARQIAYKFNCLNCIVFGSY
jgi:UDP-N-acetylglucosamine pyrophosphorylase